ncbi:hypothetical protein CIB84_007040 [Bambusicola thoracicus]|uniref:PDZ domain-containing protein n=1 Tax=Bambusicola thoracicus TaxID=9083 RepID=A0A2P4SYP2_BAMTH|nr:hypothetical protein CIB84_007040 [Bambusicola thoracicus]
MCRSRMVFDEEIAKAQAKQAKFSCNITSLNDGGKAARAHVGIGDVVLTIDGISTDGMTHLEAQNKIKACTGNLNMTLQSQLLSYMDENTAAWCQRGVVPKVVLQLYKIEASLCEL